MTEDKDVSTEKKNISISQFCRNYNISRNDFIEYLKKKKYIYSQPYGKDKQRQKNIAFPKYDTEEGIGLFEMNKKPNFFNKGKNNVNIQITPKGQDYFLEIMKKEGMIYEKI